MQNKIIVNGYELNPNDQKSLERNVRACYPGKSEIELNEIVLKLAKDNLEQFTWQKTKEVSR